MVLALYVNDIVRLKKPHPCGGSEWRIFRVGADVGLRCLTCQRRLLLRRIEVERRIKSFVARGAAPPEQGG